MRHESKQKLEILERHIFSEELKKKAVKDLVSKRTTIRTLMGEHQASSSKIYFSGTTGKRRNPKPGFKGTGCNGHRIRSICFDC